MMIISHLFLSGILVYVVFLRFILFLLESQIYTDIQRGGETERLDFLSIDSLSQVAATFRTRLLHWTQVMLIYDLKWCMKSISEEAFKIKISKTNCTAMDIALLLHCVFSVLNRHR